MLKSFLKENKPALTFIVKFVLLYLAFNSAYGYFVSQYQTQPDPITIFVSKNVAGLHRLFGEETHALEMTTSKNVTLSNANGAVIQVFEGCNSINVMVVYLAFLLAYKGSLSSTAAFAGFGVLLIYVLNLGRISALYFVEINWPRYLYFVHKYFFTLVLYVAVFALWFAWVRFQKINGSTKGS